MPAKKPPPTPVKPPAAGQETQTITPADVGTMPLTTPGDDAAPNPTASHPTKGRRYRVLGAGEGDYCIYQIAPADSQFPKGCLIPIPEVPRFETTAEAMKWVRTDSGDKLAGKQIMIFQAMEICTISVVNKPVIAIEKKPKIQVSGPETEEGEK